MRHSQEALGVYQASLSKRQTLLGRIGKVCPSEAGGGAAIPSAPGNSVIPSAQPVRQATEDVELVVLSGGSLAESDTTPPQGRGTAPPSRYRSVGELSS